MRKIDTEEITRAVSRLFKEANFELTPDVLEALKKAEQTEESPEGRIVLEQIIRNAEIARVGKIPLCQDCGAGGRFFGGRAGCPH